MDSYQTNSMSWDEFLAAWTSRNQMKGNATMMPIELTNATGTCLQDLNDDCLLEIFSCNSLTLMDLCSLAETCTCFKQITQRVFPKDYGIVCKSALICDFISKNETKVISLQNVERILKHFGLHLSKLSIWNEYSDVFKSIGKYCDDATLKSLEIWRTFRCCDALHKFIERHSHLKSINIGVCCGELLNVIDSNCKELEELILTNMFQARFSTLGSFAKLKILDLNFGYIRRDNLCDCISFLKAVKSLETMKISDLQDVVPVEIFDVLSQLENLRELHLRGSKLNGVPWTILAQLRTVNIELCTCCSQETDITHIIEQLVNLEELELLFPRNSQGLSEKDFSKICKIVERREHVLTLKCNLSFELKENCDDNRRVKLINV